MFVCVCVCVCVCMCVCVMCVCVFVCVCVSGYEELHRVSQIKLQYFKIV